MSDRNSESGGFPPKCSEQTSGKKTLILFNILFSFLYLFSLRDSIEWKPNFRIQVSQRSKGNFVFEPNLGILSMGKLCTEMSKPMAHVMSH